MISADKHRGALLALHRMMIVARHFAYDGNARDAAEVLDTAEYMQLMLLSEEDETETFRDWLEHFVLRHPLGIFALHEFDA
jgi:hypothetical protein